MCVLLQLSCAPFPVRLLRAAICCRRLQCCQLAVRHVRVHLAELFRVEERGIVCHTMWRKFVEQRHPVVLRDAPGQGPMQKLLCENYCVACFSLYTLDKRAAQGTLLSAVRFARPGRTSPRSYTPLRAVCKPARERWIQILLVARWDLQRAWAQNHRARLTELRKRERTPATPFDGVITQHSPPPFVTVSSNSNATTSRPL